MRHAGERPLGAPLVGRLVVALFVVVLAFRFAGGLAAFDEVITRTERQRRHAALGEREVIGAEEVAGFRMLVGHVAHAGGLALGDQCIEKVRLRAARGREIARDTARAERIHVDHGDRLAERIERLGRVELRTEQALLFRRHREEHDRAIGLRALRERAPDLDQGGDAGRVVDRAVVDRVAVRVRCADAEMVPVAAVDHGLVGALGPLDAADDVARGDHLAVDAVVGRERRALQFHRLEAACLRLLLERVVIEARALEQVGREVALDPAFDRRMRAARVIANDVEHVVGVGVLDRGPAVRGRRGFVHDQHAERALAGGLFVLVGPATVVGHRLAAELALPGFEVRVVDQRDRDLALEVDALVVVPVALGRIDAVADEHQRHVLDRDRLRSVDRGAHRDLLALLQRLRGVADLHRQRRRAVDARAQQRYRLRPGALAVDDIATGLEACRLELVAHPGDGFFLARGTGSAALERIGRQRLDGIGQALGIERRRLERGHGKRQAKRECAGNEFHRGSPRTRGTFRS